MSSVDRVKRLLRRRSSNERGATLVLTALSMVLLLWAGATGVDVGFTVYGSREAQVMADTAGLDLARYLSYADSMSTLAKAESYLTGKLADVLADNGSTAQLSVVPGYYANGTFTKGGYSGTSCRPVELPPPGLPGCNAIQVSADQSVPQIFFGGFNVLPGHSGNTTTGSASGSTIAANLPEATFSVGSYLTNLNSDGQQAAVLNAILSPLGTSANLTTVSYEGLANTYVTLGQLITASGSVLTANNILTQSLSASQWLQIWLDAVGNEEATANCGSSPTPDVCTADTALGKFTGGSAQVPLCSLVNINVGGTPYNCSNSSISAQGLNASLNVLQMLTTEAELANGTNPIDITSALGLSSPLGDFGTTTLTLKVDQPAQVAYGPVGTIASTAQVESTLNVNLSTLLGISIGTLSIPLSAASGTAKLAVLNCLNDAMYDTDINGATNALSGAVTLNGSQVATLSVNGATNPSVPFTAAEVPPTASTASAGENPASIGTTSPTLTFSGVSGSLDPFTTALLSSTSVLAEGYGPVLQSLGVSVAGAQIADLSTNCDAVSLVQ